MARVAFELFSDDLSIPSPDSTGPAGERDVYVPNLSIPSPDSTQEPEMSEGSG